MKKYLSKKKTLLAAFPVSVLSLAISSVLHALENTEQSPPPAPQQTTEQEAPKADNTIATDTNVEVDNPIEEVFILGRLQSSAKDLVLERMEFESVVDLLGAEQIARVGDSTAAAALKRVPGLTLVDGKFIYVRGLGERYSSSLLNGATVPSPDLTRNVIPLDIFPAGIIESIAVQKGFTANMPAAFGGGSINIRTKGIPDQFVFTAEGSLGMNSESDTGLSYSGGSDDKWGEDDGTRALGSRISNGLNTYYRSDESSEFSLDAASIQATEERNGNDITLADAQAINAQIATDINRDLDISEKSSTFQDQDIGFTIGNVFSLGDNFELGIIGSYDYGISTRTSERTERSFQDPDDEFSEERKTVENVSTTLSANIGLRWNDDHLIESKNLIIRNTDDEVAIANIYNSTSPFSSGQGSRNWKYRYEQRELEVFQLTGDHKIGYNTLEALSWGEKISFLENLEFNWFYSDATATTEIPSETVVKGNISRNTSTGEITSARLLNSLSLMDIRFTDLEDSVESSGWEIKLPITVNDLEMVFSGGGMYDQKTREYEQLDLSLGTANTSAADSLSGNISDALSDENILNPEYDYAIAYRSGLSRSYVAATTNDAFFGQADFFWDNTWRVVLGARFEEYKQFSAPWQPYRRVGSQIRADFTQTNDSGFPEGTYYQDDIYPSLALTYSTQNFWAQDFNLRFNASQTIIRPDLREVSDSSYRDPLTGIVVSGNPDAIPSDVTNYDIRAEWYFSDGASFTASLFHKEIENPIEYFQREGSEDSITAVIENSESGEVTGIELEWLKNLGFINDTAAQFYVSGNLTLSESEITVGTDIATSVTNQNRPLTGASEHVVNLQFGFDSQDGKHAATLVYNVFGERVYSAGVGEEPDSYEQPFNALDLAYSYYPTEQITVKLKMRNLLGEDVIIEKGGVDVFEETVGQSYSLGLKYDY